LKEESTAAFYSTACCPSIQDTATNKHFHCFMEIANKREKLRGN